MAAAAAAHVPRAGGITPMALWCRVNVNNAARRLPPAHAHVLQG